MLGLYGYAAVLLAVSLVLPRELWDDTHPAYLLALGSVAVWRYSWGALHLVRSLIYRHRVFPKWRREIEALGAEGMPSEIYLLVTSFRIASHTTRDVYRAAIAEAIACGARATVIASIVETADQRLLKTLFAAMAPPARVQLSFVRIAGTGKRDALAHGFRAISTMRPAADAVVAVIDGDSVLEDGLIAACAPLFRLRPQMDALTTDEVCEVEGAKIFRDWYNMRFAQRHILMSSMGLSNRVLTLTGRMSMYRARVATDPRFIARVEEDVIDHWRLGKVKLLTGDDKSTWFDILASGREMIYVPDVRVMTVEVPPDPNFLTSAAVLMRRWFGNMLRTNTRALALGPRQMGLFVWWAILDQRVSMWTSLIGPTGALLLTAFYSPFAIFFYLYWVALTRFILTLTLLTARRDVRWNYPFLLFFNQVFGSMMKTYIFFRQDRQAWTRQKTVAKRKTAGFDGWLMSNTSRAMHAVAVLVFVVATGSYLGVLDWPSSDVLALLL